MSISFIIIGVIVLVLAGGIGTYFWFRNNPRDQAEIDKTVKNIKKSWKDTKKNFRS